MGVGGERHVLAALHPRKDTHFPSYMRLSGPQGQAGWVRKTSPPPGFNPSTVQPVASHNTDWVILAHSMFRSEYKFLTKLAKLMFKSLSTSHGYFLKACKCECFHCNFLIKLCDPSVGRTLVSLLLCKGECMFTLIYQIQ
jgi:hypothetical protein